VNPQRASAAQKEITWFDGDTKQDLIAKNTDNHETSFKTINYDTTFSLQKPKPAHPGRQMYKTSYNIVTGTKDVGEDRESGIEVPYGQYQSVSQ
jgi:hypothetical protein